MARSIRHIPITAESPFTPDTLRELIGRTLGNRYAPPGAPEAEQLCGTLNLWHAQFYQAQEMRAFNAIAEETAAAIETLQRTLPLLGNHHFDRAQRGDQFARWRYEATAELYQAVNKDPARVTHRDSVPDQVRDWRWLAAVAQQVIDDAMRPANPDFPPGHSKGGPVSRILAAIIPRICGDVVTAVAIGNHLTKPTD